MSASTTREGGEGVLTEREACARIADELADDPHDIGAKIAARIRNRTEQDSFLALATTSSPDASPDTVRRCIEVLRGNFGAGRGQEALDQRNDDIAILETLL